MAAFDLSMSGGMLFGWLSSVLFWGILIIIVFGLGIVILIGRKTRRLKFPVLEITRLGGGKIGVLKTKAGWFKTKTMFFGLIETGGEEILKTKKGKRILEASSEDYQDIGGKRGLIVIRKGDDPKILVPISKVDLDKTSNTAIMSIAPADYRDAANKLIDDAVNESRGIWERYLPMIMFSFMGIIFLVCIILIVQLVKSSQATALEYTQEALSNMKSSAQAAASAAAPILLFYKRKWFG